MGRRKLLGVLYYKFIYKSVLPCYSSIREQKRALPGKEKDMIAVRFALSFKEHQETQSSYPYLDGLFARSYKAKPGICMVS